MDSIDYWHQLLEGALDAEDEIEHFVRRQTPWPRSVRAFDDVA